MNRSSHWKIIACLVLLILLSGLLGGELGFRMARKRFEQRSNPESWNEAAMRTFDHTVRPSVEQREILQKLLDRAVGDLKQIRADTISRSTNVIWRLVADVEKELTPEQKVQFQKMKPSQEDISTVDMLKVDSRK